MVEKSYLELLEECFPGIKNNIIRCQAIGFPWSPSKLFLKENNDETLSRSS